MSELLDPADKRVQQLERKISEYEQDRTLMLVPFEGLNERYQRLRSQYRIPPGFTYCLRETLLQLADDSLDGIDALKALGAFDLALTAAVTVSQAKKEGRCKQTYEPTYNLLILADRLPRAFAKLHGEDRIHFLKSLHDVCNPVPAVANPDVYITKILNTCSSKRM